MSNETRKNILFFSIIIGVIVALFFVANMRSKMVVTNTSSISNATTTTPMAVENEVEKAIKEIQSRPDVQKQFYNLAKEIYLTEKRNKVAEELKSAEAELETHKAESTSF